MLREMGRFLRMILLPFLPRKISLSICLKAIFNRSSGCHKSMDILMENKAKKDGMV
jgi:hypothetical protein